MKNSRKGNLLFTMGFVLVGVASSAQQDIRKMHVVYQDKESYSIMPRVVTYRDTLKADVYVPDLKLPSERRPCVIFVSGFAGLNFPKMQAYIDWARLMARHGMVGVVYETNSPAVDFDKVTEYVIANSESLNIDTENIGIWSCSGNTLLAVNKVNESNRFKCHSIYYGLATTFNSKYLDEVREMSNQLGFEFFVRKEYTSRIPTFIVRAGKDHWTTIQNGLDEFINELIAKNVSLELINNPEGRHAFDIVDDNDTSREIIVRTIAFFQRAFSK